MKLNNLTKKAAAVFDKIQFIFCRNQQPDKSTREYAKSTFVFNKNSIEIFENCLTYMYEKSPIESD